MLSQNSLFTSEDKTWSLWSPPQLKSPKDTLFKYIIDGKIISITINMLLNLRSLILNLYLNFGNEISLKKKVIEINKINKKVKGKFKCLI